MDTRDQQVDTMNQQNGLNSSNQSKQNVVLHPKSSNHNNSSYNVSNKGISQYNTLPSSHQSKPMKKKGFYNGYNGYPSAYHYGGNNKNNYYNQHKFNSNHMNSKSQGKNLNYHRAYNNQSHQSSNANNNNHNNNNSEKYDSVANSVSPPSISNSSNNTSSPSNLASPNSLNNVSSSTNPISASVSVSDNANQTNSAGVSSKNSIESSNAVKQLKQITESDQSPKIDSASNRSTIDTASNLANDMNNLQIDVNNSMSNSKSQQSQPSSTIVVEKNTALFNQTMSFKTTNTGQNSQQQNYSNYHSKPHSPDALVSSNMIMNSNNVGISSGKPSVSLSSHYSGSRHNQSNKMHYSNNNNNSYSMNNSLNNNTSSYPFQSKINNYSRGGKKPQHLLNTANSKSPQIMSNQSNMPNNNGTNYAKMNSSGMTHLVSSVANKMMPNPTISQNHSIIPTHPQMIATNGYPIFYNPNFINQHSHNQITMSNAMHNQNVHLPQNCVQCQYSMNGQYMHANTYHPTQFVHFPYQYNPNQMTGISHPAQSITGPMNSNLPQQQPQHHRVQYSDSQINRSNQQPNVNQSTTNAQHQQNINSNSSALTKYAQQQDHMAAPTHLPPAHFAYNSYMPIHAIPNYYSANYYSAAASNYNESQLNHHLIPNSSTAMMAQQLQVSIMNNLQHQTQTNHSTMMGQQSQNDQFGGSSNVESISNTAENSRSNLTTNYDANNSNYNSLLLQTAPQQTLNHPPNAISPLSQFDGHAMNSKFYSTNYMSNNTLSDYNSIIWSQQQQQNPITASNAINTNVLISNTGSNTNHFTNEDMLSSHNPSKTSTNANKNNNTTYNSNTDNSANSNIVNQIADSTGLLDKK